MGSAAIASFSHARASKSNNVMTDSRHGRPSEVVCIIIIPTKWDVAEDLGLARMMKVLLVWLKDHCS